MKMKICKIPTLKKNKSKLLRRRKSRKNHIERQLESKYQRILTRMMNQIIREIRHKLN
jgi:hypothetical protein